MENDRDEIRNLLHVEPFRPIRIVLGDKQSYVVTHTDYVMISPEGTTVHFFDDKGRVKIVNSQQIKVAEPVSRRASKTN